MSEAKRYRHFPAQYARMFIDTLPSGEYVTGADYNALAADNKRLREALEVVAQWNFPATGQKWPSGGEMSYGACFGSNGERDYMRRVASTALAGSKGGEL